MGNKEISFPKDEGRHKYLVEWWYGNYHLRGKATGKEYGLMVAYFNNGMRLAAITDISRRRYYPFTSPGLIYVSDHRLNLFHLKKRAIDRWYQKEKSFSYHWRANLGTNRVELDLESEKPPLLLGGDGLVKVGSGGESYYYSLTRLKVTGRLKMSLQGEEAVEGIGWMDHQYGNFGPVPGSQGYEWFSVQMNNGAELVCYNIWEQNQRVTPLCCWLDEHNISHYTTDFVLIPLDYWVDEKKRRYAKRWRLRYPELGTPVFDLVIHTAIENQKINFLLYEGVIYLEPGSVFNGYEVEGVGYAELTHRATLRKIPPFSSAKVKV